MTTKLNYKINLIVLVFLIGFYASAQTVTPFLDPSLKFVKTMNTFNKVGESTDGKVWYTTINSQNVLNFLNTDGSINAFSQDLGGVVNAIVPTNDSKILVGGNFTNYNSSVVSARLLRLNSDGSRDFTFSASSNANEVTALHILFDGKIMVGRNTQIQRLNADGSIDTAFTTVVTNGKVNDFCVSSAGKVFAVGTFTSVNSITKNRAILINTDGTIDTTFNIGTGFNEEVKGIKRTSTNNLYIIGAFSNYNGANVNRFVKLNETGILNTAFNNTLAGFNDNPLTVEVSNNDKLLIGGLFTMYNTINVKNFVFINEDGTINPSFNVGNSFENGSVNNITKNSLGNYIITGEFVKYNDVFTNQIVKVSNNGSIVSGFAFGNSFNLNSFIDFIPQNSDYILRYAFSGNPIRIKRQNDKILLSEVYVNNKRYPLARFNNGGTLDNTFLFNKNNLNLPSNLRFSFIRDFVFTPSGKIFLFMTNRRFFIETDYATSFIQLNADGTSDNTFSNQNYYKPQYNDQWYHSENLGYVRSDNKILWANDVLPGTGTYKDVVLKNNLNLLLPNGELDESYISNSLNYNDYVDNCKANYYQDFNSTKLLPLPNNETLAYTPFTSYCRFNGTSNNVSAGVTKATIGRFNSNGTLATDYLNLDLYQVFHVNYFNEFLYFGGVTKDGTRGKLTGFFKKIDIATNREVPFNHQLVLGVNSIEIKRVVNTLFKDNKIYVVIFVSSVDGPNFSEIIDYQIKRLNLDGTLDPTFSTLNVTKDRYYTYYNQTYSPSLGERFQLELVDNPTENSFLIASRCPFTINGTYYEQAFVKVDLNNLSTIENQFSENTFKVHPNPTNDKVNISSESETINQINVYNLLGGLLKSQKGSSDKETISLQEFPNATYILEIISDKAKQSVKVIKK